MDRYCIREESIRYQMYDGYVTSVWNYYYNDGTVETLTTRVPL